MIKFKLSGNVLKAATLLFLQYTVTWQQPNLQVCPQHDHTTSLQDPKLAGTDILASLHHHIIPWWR
jgi:hypothetical protein